MTLNLFAIGCCLILLIIKWARAVESFQIRSGSDRSGHLAMIAEIWFLRNFKEKMHYVCGNENLWKPDLLYQLIGKLKNPFKPKIYKFLQLLFSSGFDFLSVLPSIFILKTYGILGSSEAVLFVGLFLLLPSLNSVNIRSESFGQRTFSPAVYQAFIFCIWWVEQNLPKHPVLITLLWALLLAVSYKTSLFFFQIAFLNASLLGILFLQPAPICGMAVYILLKCATQKNNLIQFINERKKHYEAQIRVRENAEGIILGSSLIIRRLYDCLKFTFKKRQSKKQNALSQMKSVLINQNDELVRFFVAFLPILIGVCFLYLQGDKFLISESTNKFKEVFGDNIVKLTIVNFFIFISVLLIPRFVAIGEASRYVEYSLPQIFSWFWMCVNSQSGDFPAMFWLIFLLLVFSESLLKQVFFFRKTYGNQTYLKNLFLEIAAIFKKPPLDLFCIEKKVLKEILSRLIARPSAAKKYKLCALPLKQNSTFLIAAQILGRKCNKKILKKLKFYSMWRDTSVFSSKKIFNSNIYLPNPNNFKPILCADILAIKNEYLHYYQKFLERKKYSLLPDLKGFYSIYFKEK
jgi:hypothetical protein